MKVFKFKYCAVLPDNKLDGFDLSVFKNDEIFKYQFALFYLLKCKVQLGKGVESLMVMERMFELGYPKLMKGCTFKEFIQSNMSFFMIHGLRETISGAKMRKLKKRIRADGVK